MSYFSRFPNMVYDMNNDGNYKLLPDILRRVKSRTAVKSGRLLFDQYDVKNGENPEDVAFKYYGDAQLHWVVLMVNEVTDRFYQWPMSQQQFDKFLTDKYGAGNEDSAHHYELVKDSGKTTSSGPNDYSHRVEVNSDETDAIEISNRDYEERLQDKFRTIRLLDRRYLDEFIEEFDNLIKQ
tara:strand:- start:175 stop:717 length:543 start_codon:yes stop_codon:yes gene_type:complete